VDLITNIYTSSIYLYDHVYQIHIIYYIKQIKYIIYLTCGYVGNPKPYRPHPKPFILNLGRRQFLVHSN